MKTAKAERCSCGRRFTRERNGVPFWCLACDAHRSGCAMKGSSDNGCCLGKRK